MCAGGKLSGETSIQLDLSITLAPVMPEARKDLLGAFFPFLRQSLQSTPNLCLLKSLQCLRAVDSWPDKSLIRFCCKWSLFPKFCSWLLCFFHHFCFMVRKMLNLGHSWLRNSASNLRKQLSEQTFFDLLLFHCCSTLESQPGKQSWEGSWPSI